MGDHAGANRGAGGACGTIERAVGWFGETAEELIADTGGALLDMRNCLIEFL